MFYYCGELGELDIPDSVSAIGGSGDELMAGGVFNMCLKLTAIRLPEKLSFISEYAFRSSGFTFIDIPGNVEEISWGAFSSCFDLAKVTISSGVKTIRKHAFAGCPSLMNITIPDSATTLEDDIFRLPSKSPETLPVTIHCNEGSAAHDYALKNKIAFEFI